MPYSGDSTRSITFHIHFWVQNIPCNEDTSFHAYLYTLPANSANFANFRKGDLLELAVLAVLAVAILKMSTDLPI